MEGFSALYLGVSLDKSCCFFNKSCCTVVCIKHWFQIFYRTDQITLNKRILLDKIMPLFISTIFQAFVDKFGENFVSRTSPKRRQI